MIDSILYALTCALAGLLSFLSPCVLPLIPSYLCVIGGSPMQGAEEKEWNPRLVARTVSFILGFSAVFIVLSVLFSAVFSLTGSGGWINIISGILVIVLGLNIIFEFLSFTNFEKKIRLSKQPGGFTGTFLAGAAFGAGWTPCVGPVLAGILLLAAQSGGIPKAVVYLACYSAGLALPFLLASVFFNKFIAASARLRPRLPLIRKISGALLVVIGVLMITGQYQKLNSLSAKWQEKLTRVNKPAAGDKANAESGGQEKNFTSVQVAADAVSPEVIRAFSAAGLPVARTGGKPADFTLPLLNGTEQTLSDLTGQAVFLNFWATWCGPCRIEMPSMEEVYRGLKDKGFTILAVNGGESAAQVSGFMRENKLTFPVALDTTGRINRQYGIRAIPTTYILDRRGNIVSRVVGSLDWNQPGIVTALETLLGE